MRGVGAFGYYDTAARKYILFSPPEAAPYEVSATLVELDAVWAALDPIWGGYIDVPRVD